MKTITVLVEGPNQVELNVLPAYRIDITITAANDITSKLFVKQRIKNADNTTDDNFVAVASPTNIADFAEDAPKAGENYFRTNAVSFVSSDINLVHDTVQEVLDELALLIEQESLLDSIASTSVVYSITPSGITITS